MIGRNPLQDMVLISRPSKDDFGAGTQYRNDIARAGQLVRPNTTLAVKPSMLNNTDLSRTRVQTSYPVPMSSDNLKRRMTSHDLKLPTVRGTR